MPYMLQFCTPNSLIEADQTDIFLAWKKVCALIIFAILSFYMGDMREHVFGIN